MITLIGCNSPTVENDVESCVTSKKFQVSKCGARVLNYKEKRSMVGEWRDTEKLTIKPLEQMDDQVCFSLESYLTKIKPKLKEGHDFWADNGKKKKSKLTDSNDNESIIEDEL